MVCKSRRKCYKFLLSNHVLSTPSENRAPGCVPVRVELLLYLREGIDGPLHMQVLGSLQEWVAAGKTVWGTRIAQYAEEQRWLCCVRPGPVATAPYLGRHTFPTRPRVRLPDTPQSKSTVEEESAKAWMASRPMNNVSLALATLPSPS